MSVSYNKTEKKIFSFNFFKERKERDRKKRTKKQQTKLASKRVEYYNCARIQTEQPHFYRVLGVYRVLLVGGLCYNRKS